MKHALNFLRSSIFSKITVLTAVVLLSVSTISTGILINQFSNDIRDKNILLVNEATDKIYNFFQNSYNIAFNQRTLLHSTNHIADSIASTRQNPSNIYKQEHLNKITSYMTALTYSDPHIDDVILFTADGKNSFSYSSKSSRNVYLGYNFNTLPYIKNLRNSPTTITAVYDKNLPYLNKKTDKKNPAITFIVKIFDMNGANTQKLLGYLMINYSPDTVTSSYNNLTEASNGNYMVVNNHSKIIFSTDPALLNQHFSSYIVPIKDIVSTKSLSLSGMEVISTLNNDKLREDALHTIRQSILIAGLGILFSIIVLFFLYRHYAKKFQQLASAMETMSNGDFSTQLPVHSNDEIGYLSTVFNQMGSTLNDYISRHFLAETQRRTAELYALQAQINPHFLANTIESIRMNTLENDDIESAEMLKKLGNLFRWMVHFNQDIVYVEDELEYIQSYLDLQKFRFCDRLSVDIDLTSDIYYLGIPRFTLQPIIENVLSHGSPGTRPLQIEILFSLEEDTLVITIKDNGSGITAPELRKLNDHIHGIIDCPEFGVALRNIHTRIQLLFNDPYGLKVESIYNQGTVVTVTLPAKDKKELEDYV